MASMIFIFIQLQFSVQNICFAKSTAVEVKESGERERDGKKQGMKEWKGIIRRQLRLVCISWCESWIASNLSIECNWTLRNFHKCWKWVRSIWLSWFIEYFISVKLNNIQIYSPFVQHWYIVEVNNQTLNMEFRMQCWILFVCAIINSSKLMSP